MLLELGLEGGEVYTNEVREGHVQREWTPKGNGLLPGKYRKPYERSIE